MTLSLTKIEIHEHETIGDNKKIKYWNKYKTKESVFINKKEKSETNKLLTLVLTEIHEK